MKIQSHITINNETSNWISYTVDEEIYDLFTSVNVYSRQTLIANIGLTCAPFAIHLFNGGAANHLHSVFLSPHLYGFFINEALYSDNDDKR